MNIAHTSNFDRRMRDRWERMGNPHPPKRSARFTKPGPRPRASTLLQARKRQEMVNKVDEALKAHYHIGDLGSVIYQPTWLSNAGEGTDVWNSPLRTNPYPLTGSGLTVNSGIYSWGVDYGGTETTAASTITVGTTATNYTTGGFVINPTFQPVTLDWGMVQRQNAQRAAAAGMGVDQYFGASWLDETSAVPPTWATHIRIVADPRVPQDQIWVQQPDQNGWFYPDTNQWVPLDPRQRFRQQMMPQRDPCRADRVSFENCPPAELTALSLLKKMVDEPGWRTYLKYGFVNIRGKSGLDYQIRRGQWHVLVRNQGTKVAELCVGLSASMPPTDAVIARMLMAECDEPELWRRANVDTMPQEGLKLNDMSGRPAWRRYHSSPENHKILERLCA